MNSPASDSEQRRAARGTWRVVKTTLTAPEQPQAPQSPAAALGMMWQLALDAWSMTGRPLPDYPRSRIPVRLATIQNKGTETPR